MDAAYLVETKLSDFMLLIMFNKGGQFMDILFS